MSTTPELPRHIQASISPEAVKKVTRFLSAELDDILLELFQNARRGGATRVNVRTIPNIARSRTQVTVTDDGRGIADPAQILTFGESQWDEATKRSEDPAGMGLYSLALKGAEITSTPTSGPAWKTVLTPEHFTSEAPAEIIKIARASKPGTSISFTVDHDGLDPRAMERRIRGEVKSAAKYQRIPVILNGKRVKQRHINRKAFWRERWDRHQNIEIGVHRPHGYMGTGRRLALEVNGHPVPLTELGSVQVLGDDTFEPLEFYATVSADDVPELPLVLPARKDTVRTRFLTDELIPASKRAIYRALQEQHEKLDVVFSDSNRDEASILGVTLPQPPRRLSPGIGSGFEPVTDLPPESEPGAPPDAILVGEIRWKLGWLVNASLEDATRRRGPVPLFWQSTLDFDKTRWYPRLPKLTKLQVRLEDREHGNVEWEATKPPPQDLGQHGRRPDRIVFIAKSRSTKNVSFPDIEFEGTWLAIGENLEGRTEGPPTSNINNALLFISKTATDDDYEPMIDYATSATTERLDDEEDIEMKRRTWEQRADAILYDDEQARLRRVRKVVMTHLRDVIPPRHQGTVVIGPGDEIDIRIEPIGPQETV